MKILFLRSQKNGENDQYELAVKTGGHKPYTFSPIEKSTLPLDDLYNEISRISEFQGLIMTSVSTGGFIRLIFTKNDDQRNI
jgi:hypothetical protein